MQFTFWEEPLADDMPDDSGALSSRCVGKAGEYIVAAECELAGYRCSFASEGLPYDLIVEVGGKLRKVQVKTTARGRCRELPEGKVWRGYVFTCGSSDKRVGELADDVDVFAFVALDKRAATYIPALNIRSGKHIKIADKHFSNEPLRQLSLTQALSPE